MQYNVYSVYDVKAKFFVSPFMMLQDGEAIRAFSDEVNKDGSALNKHPEDYVLFKLAVFDQETGKYSSDAPVSLVSGMNVFVEKKS